MRYFRVFALWLKTLFHRSKVDSELKSELEDYLAQETAANLRSGMSAEQAGYAARRALGPVALYEEQCRDARGTGWFDNFMRDARYAFRVLGHSPLFTVVAIVTLGLGIGANTAVFTLVNKLLLRPLPVKDPQQLFSLVSGQSVNFSYPNYRDIRDRNDVLSGLAALRIEMLNLSVGAGRNFRLWGYEVTGNYFELLGVHPYLGRFFGPSEDIKRGANPLIVLGYGCWQSRFAADRGVIGRRVKVNGFDFTVIGVAKPDFIGTELIVNPEFWVPMSMVPQVEPGSKWLDSRFAANVWQIGRLKAGVTRAQAQASLQRVTRQLSHDYPKENEGLHDIELTTPGLVGNAFRGPVTAFAAVVMGVAGLVLLLACINLAGLLLARASDRRKEIAVRLSIGAGRGRLVRQLLTESLLLAASGAIAGSLLAFGLTHVLKLWHPPVDVPLNTAFDPDLSVLGFTCLLTLVTTLLCGLVPALQSTKLDLVPALKSDAARRRSRSFAMRDILVVAQIGVSMILLITSLLVVRSLQHALQINLGFDPTNAVSVSFDLGLQGYTEARGRDFQTRLLEKVSHLPGVRAAGLINNMPLRLGEDNEEVSIIGKPKRKGQSDTSAHLYNISPGYLRGAGTRLLAGRDIDLYDGANAPPVALVNETLVRKLLPNEDPIGKRFRLGPNEKAPIHVIVGVVEAGKYESLGEDPDLAVFVPVAQQYNGWTTIVVRTSLQQREALRELRRAVSEMDSDMPLFNVESLEGGLAWALLPARFAAGILGSFGAVAVLLAAIGVFALVAYSIGRRSREIGIRMALGAQASQVLTLVLRRMALLCTVGAVLGTILALAGSQVLSAFLYGVSPRDRLTYALSLLLLAVVTLIASWHPARRAIRIDPARTLREE